MKKIIAAVALLGFGTAQSALVDRGSGFIYDDVQDITWLQDANYAETSGVTFGGAMLYGDAIAWADGLGIYDSVRNVTFDDWRLPTTMQPDSSCSEQVTTSEGYNCAGSEMGHLYYVDGITSNSPGFFDHLDNIGGYWSGTAVENVTWRFQYTVGLQRRTAANSLGSRFFVWAVRDGDVAASVVPVPAAVWLFASGLGLLGWMKRSRANL